MGWNAHELENGWSLWVRHGIYGWFVKHRDRDEEVHVPDELIKQLIAEEVRDHWISELEGMEADTLLGSIKPSALCLNVDNPLFEGLVGGVEPSVLYATIKHLKQQRDECRRLLREAVLRDGLCDERWFEEAREVTGGEDAMG